jgi:hypothetical protein
MSDEIIDFEAWRQKHKSATIRKLDKITRNLDNIDKIIRWSADMHHRGLMPPEIALAFHEYFSGELPE